ncbi:MAG: DedA family protein [Myxococcota bacterium]|nr:DedA family protein [Myxococcota bacterium]MDW8361361.1 DedA family protein [Myxococcales bacterium]
MDPALQWVRDHHGPLGYAALGLAAAAEYVVPPIPGDLIVLFGAFLAARAGWSAAGVWLVCTGASLLGMLAAWRLGLGLGDRWERWPSWLRTDRTRALLASMQHRFERHGPWVLLANRFVPAFRMVVFVAAGLARAPACTVLAWGGASAAIWNALLLVAGWTVGDNWERLVAFAQNYTRVAFVVALALVVALGLVLWWRRRRTR